MIKIRSLRGRLIAWHLGILAISLVLFSVLLHQSLSRSLYRHHDDELATEATRLSRALADMDFSGDTALALAASQISEEFAMIRNLQGALLYRSLFLEVSEPNIGQHEALVHAATVGAMEPLFFTAQLERAGPVRFICVPIGMPPRAYLQIGRPLGDVPETLRSVVVACALLVPVVMLLMSFGGWVVARRALAPVKSIDETLRTIQATDLSRRIDVPVDAELEQLVTTLNRLLDRLEKAFSSLADDAERRYRRHRGDRALARLRFVHDHVARQEQTDLQFGVQGTIRKRRIACTEDDVLTEIAIELLLERLLHVDRRQNAKAFGLEGVGGSLESLFVGKRDENAQAVTSLFHESPRGEYSCRVERLTVSEADASVIDSFSRSTAERLPGRSDSCHQISTRGIALQA